MRNAFILLKSSVLPLYSNQIESFPKYTVNRIFLLHSTKQLENRPFLKKTLIIRRRCFYFFYSRFTWWHILKGHKKALTADVLFFPWMQPKWFSNRGAKYYKHFVDIALSIVFCVRHVQRFLWLQYQSSSPRHKAAASPEQTYSISYCDTVCCCVHSGYLTCAWEIK